MGAYPLRKAIGAPVKAIGGGNDDSSKAIIIAIISYNFSYNLAIIDWKNSLIMMPLVCSGPKIQLGRKLSNWR